MVREIVIALAALGPLACGGRVLVDADAAPQEDADGGTAASDPTGPSTAAPGVDPGGSAPPAASDTCPVSSLVMEGTRCDAPGRACPSSIGPCNEPNLAKTCTCDANERIWRCERCKDGG